MKMQAPPPPPPPQPDPFVEEQMEILADKVEGLEGELRYAWRALDVLSQEYIKMWQRLEKMEGLLSEQQTVISQLIDLYSVDSSDNADKSGGASPSSGGGVGPGGQRAVPDEDFYKALNAMHGDMSGSQSLEDFISPDQASNDGDGGFPFLSGGSGGGNGTNSNNGHSSSPRASKQGTFNDFISQYDGKDQQQSGNNNKKATKQLKGQRGGGGGGGSSMSSKQKAIRRQGGSQGASPDDSDIDAKSVTSSVRSSRSGTTVRSEDVGEFPLPSDLSPNGYDNITPPLRKDLELSLIHI